MQKPPHFFENLISILLFIFVYYAVTSNPVVKPKHVEVKGLWSIEKAQSALLFGLASHNYLILRNDSDEIMRELHGIPQETNGELEKVALTSGRNLSVVEVSYPLFGTASTKPSAVTVFAGSQKDVEAKWKEALSCGKEINEKKLPYPALGINFEEDTINSNSVATTLLSCMHLPSPRVGLLTPGAQTIIPQ